MEELENANNVHLKKSRVVKKRLTESLNKLNKNGTNVWGSFMKKPLAQSKRLGFNTVNVSPLKVTDFSDDDETVTIRKKKAYIPPTPKSKISLK